MITTQQINKITSILSKQPKYSFLIDNLVFTNDTNEKISFIKELMEIPEFNNGELKNIWASILLIEVKKIKKE